MSIMQTSMTYRADNTIDELYWSTYVPNFNYAHEVWIMTKTMRPQLWKAKMALLHRVTGLTLRDRVRSCIIQGELKVGLLLFHIRRHPNPRGGPWRCFRHFLLGSDPGEDPELLGGIMCSHMHENNSESPRRSRRPSLGRGMLWLPF